MQDERRKEIAKRTQALEAIDLDIQAQRKQIADLHTKKGQTGRPTKQGYNPSNVQGQTPSPRHQWPKRAHRTQFVGIGILTSIFDYSGFF